MLTGTTLTGANRRQTPSIIAAAAVIGLGASAGFGYGFMHYRQIAVGQEAMMRRVETANADLQDALDRLRDDNRKRLQQLDTENGRLQSRLSELEQQLASLKPGMYQPHNAAAAPRVTRAPGPVVAPAGLAPAGLAPAGLAPAGLAPAGLAPAGLAPAGLAPAGLPALPVAAAPIDKKNFSPPGWVPDFFSAESDAFVGSSMQPRPPPPENKARR